MRQENSLTDTKTLFHIPRRDITYRIPAGAAFTDDLQNAIEEAEVYGKADIYVFTGDDDLINQAFIHNGDGYQAKCHIRKECCDHLVVAL